MAQYIEIDGDGNTKYFKDKEMTILHREDGPAEIWADGHEFYFLDGIFLFEPDWIINTHPEFKKILHEVEERTGSKISLVTTKLMKH